MLSSMSALSKHGSLQLNSVYADSHPSVCAMYTALSQFCLFVFMKLSNRPFGFALARRRLARSLHALVFGQRVHATQVKRQCT